MGILVFYLCIYVSEPESDCVNHFLINVIKHLKEATKRRKNYFGSWFERIQSRSKEGMVAGRARGCDRRGVRELVVSWWKSGSI